MQAELASSAMQVAVDELLAADKHLAGLQSPSKLSRCWVHPITSHRPLHIHSCSCARTALAITLPLSLVTHVQLTGMCRFRAADEAAAEHT